jgi:hypothetical protein
LKDFTFQNNNQLVCNKAGVYFVSWDFVSASQSISQAQSLYGGVMINSSLSSIAQGRVTLPLSYTNSYMGASGIFTLSNNDVLNLALKNGTGDYTIGIFRVNFSIMRVS